MYGNQHNCDCWGMDCTEFFACVFIFYIPIIKKNLPPILTINKCYPSSRPDCSSKTLFCFSIFFALPQPGCHRLLIMCLFILPFRSIYSPYDPFLATSLAQVQANGLAAAIQQAQQAGGNHGLDPRLQVIFTAPCILLKPIENTIQRFRIRC